MYNLNVLSLKLGFRLHANYTLKKSKNSCNPETAKKCTMDSDLDELSFYGKKIKELTNIQQYSIISILLGMEVNGALPKGSLAEVAEIFQTSPATGASKTLAI